MKARRRFTFLVTACRLAGAALIMFRSVTKLNFPSPLGYTSYYIHHILTSNCHAPVAHWCHDDHFSGRQLSSAPKRLVSSQSYQCSGSTNVRRVSTRIFMAITRSFQLTLTLWQTRLNSNVCTALDPRRRQIRYLDDSEGILVLPVPCLISVHRDWVLFTPQRHLMMLTGAFGNVILHPIGP